MQCNNLIIISKYKKEEEKNNISNTKKVRIEFAYTQDKEKKKVQQKKQETGSFEIDIVRKLFQVD